MAEKEDQHHVVVPPKAYGFPAEAFDPSRLPDADAQFLRAEEIEAFIQALSASDQAQSPTEDGASLRSPSLRSFSSLDFTKRSSSGAVDGAEDPQVVAAHAAAAAGDPAAPSPGPGDGFHGHNDGGAGTSNSGPQPQPMFISAQSDWAPVHQKVVSTHHTHTRRSGGGREGGGRRNARRARAPPRPGRRTRDETREGYLYGLLKWPFLLAVGAWIVGLAAAYLATRAYIWAYEQLVAWRGRRERLRRNMRATSRYADWVAAARELDDFLGNTAWKERNEFAYYDSKTVRRVWEQLRRCRAKAEAEEPREAAEKDKTGSSSSSSSSSNTDSGGPAAVATNGNGAKTQKKPAATTTSTVDDLKVLVEACVKNNFVGVENARLYSQTYCGTKHLVQNFVDEVERSVRFLLTTKRLGAEEKRGLFKRLHANYGRTALCLSGGASFAYYHFGVVKALLEQDLLPDVITGTSGGALVAALVATRTNAELRELLVPALAAHITACREPVSVWARRWWRTGARFDSVDWARQSGWWTRGSTTFREAYARTGRILNVSCVPADPHSPTILCNYLTSPDCVIWSAVLASAAVPGILNPVVLMMKRPDGSLAPYSFGHKWKDGSLRTDIPIRALNLHFNVNFTIVSQVNPHINLFFFSSRGSVGQPVTHRRGRGWRGGYLGSAAEQLIKLELNKNLRVLKTLELLPRPLGQDWSQLWLQQFGGTVTIWPKSILSDFVHILSDPDPPRLARMIHEGQQSAYPKLNFISNRLRVERLVERGRRETRPHVRRGSIESIISEDDLHELLLLREGPDTDATGGGVETGPDTGPETATCSEGEPEDEETIYEEIEGDGADTDNGVEYAPLMDPEPEAMPVPVPAPSPASTGTSVKKD